MDCKATVKIGAFSRGGQTRGEYKASDHDFGSTEQYIPCGILDEDTAQLSVTFGSSAKTSDFIVDTLAAWWHATPLTNFHREGEKVLMRPGVYAVVPLPVECMGGAVD